MKCKTWYSRFRKETNKFLIGQPSSKAPVLYNLIFPVYLLLFLPPSYIWIFAVVLNFVVDSLVIWFAARKFRADFIKLWKKVFLKVYLLGWLADFLGALIWIMLLEFIPSLFGIFFGLNTYRYPGLLVIAIPMILTAGYFIYIFNRKWAWNKSGLSKAKIQRAALWMCIWTMPYTVLIPTSLFF